MGKRLRQQRSGKGSVFKSVSFKHKGRIKYTKRVKDKQQGEVKDLINCSGHSAPLAIVQFDKTKIAMPAYEGMRSDAKIEQGKDAEIKKGTITDLMQIPEGTQIYNIENRPGDGGKFVRSAGTAATVITKTDKHVIVKMPSKKKKTFNPSCRATIGIIAGGGRKEKPLLKAGINFKKRKAQRRQYPTVKGVSMNSLSHPHGGTSSRSKGRPTTARRFAPPGAKVGSIRPRRTGRRKGK